MKLLRVFSVEMDSKQFTMSNKAKFTKMVSRILVSFGLCLGI